MENDVLFDISSVRAAKTTLRLLHNRFVNGGSIPQMASVSSKLTFAQRMDLARNHGRNQAVFVKEDVVRGVLLEVVRQDGGGSIITRRGHDMADQAVILAEVLEKSMELMDSQLDKFNAVSDKAIDSAKKKVAQLNDFSARLTQSLTNLNKVLGDERMVKALQNAETLANALTLLDELEKKGALQKVMAALQSSKN